MKPRSIVSVLLSGSLVMSSGCTKTVITKMARHEIGGPTVLEAVPEAGIYKVKWAGPSREFRGVGESERLLAKGMKVGFESTDDGVIAVANEERIRVSNVPDEARYFVGAPGVVEIAKLVPVIAVLSVAVTV